MVNSGGNLSETPLQKLLEELAAAVYENLKDLMDVGSDGAAMQAEAEVLSAINKVYDSAGMFQI